MLINFVTQLLLLIQNYLFPTNAFSLSLKLSRYLLHNLYYQDLYTFIKGSKKRNRLCVDILGWMIKCDVDFRNSNTSYREWLWIKYILTSTLITKLTCSCVTSRDINSGSEKQGFIHAFPFLKVAIVLASHCKASYWRVLPFNSSLISVCELQEYF